MNSHQAVAVAWLIPALWTLLLIWFFRRTAAREVAVREREREADARIECALSWRETVANQRRELRRLNAKMRNLNMPTSHLVFAEMKLSGGAWHEYNKMRTRAQAAEQRLERALVKHKPARYEPEPDGLEPVFPATEKAS